MPNTTGSHTDVTSPLLTTSAIRLPQSADFPLQRAMPDSLRRWQKLRRLCVDKRYAKLLTFLGIIIPLFGYTLREFVPQHFGIIALFFTILIGAAFIILSRPFMDEYEGKPQVDWAWEEMLRRADSSIEVVAGDIDWLHDDRNIARLLAAKREYCSIKVVCKAPEYNPIIRRGIASLLALNAEVRVRPAALGFIRTTGILIDRENAGNRAALRVRVTGTQGELSDQVKKVYWAKRDLPGRDYDHLESWQALVDSYWDRSVKAVLLERLPPTAPPEQEIIRDALLNVALYKKAQFEIRDVEVATLSAWCLREDKLRLTEDVVPQFKLQQVPYFEPCICWSNYKTSVLLPPIVEQHGQQLVVMEGTHRLWHLLRNNEYARARVIVVSTTLPLPGIPKPISDLPLFSHRLGPLGREHHIEHYNEQYWRSFTPMDNHLHLLGSTLVERLIKSASE
jgi:hypothetical protein